MSLEGYIAYAARLEDGQETKGLSGAATLAAVRALTQEAIESRRENDPYGNRVSGLLRAAARLARHCKNQGAKQQAEAIVDRAYNLTTAAG